MITRTLTYILIIALVLIAGFFILNSYIYQEKQADAEDPSISLYDECIEAGYPSLDSYPEQCETPSGKRFVRNLPQDELGAVTTPITAHGTIVCLPHWNTEGPQTLECAFGFLDSTGQHYALRNSDPRDQSVVMTPTNVPVSVKGTVIPGSVERYQSVGTIEVDEIAVWQTAEAEGISFAYPETLFTTYVSPVDWPPQIQIIDEPFGCEPAGAENERAGKTEERQINERTYCVTTVTEGAAGSMYRQYAYAAPLNGQTLILTFSLRYPQCANYSEPERTMCENEQEFNVDALMDELFQSIEQTQ